MTANLGNKLKHRCWKHWIRLSIVFIPERPTRSCPSTSWFWKYSCTTFWKWLCMFSETVHGVRGAGTVTPFDSYWSSCTAGGVGTIRKELGSIQSVLKGSCQFFRYLLPLFPFNLGLNPPPLFQSTKAHQLLQRCFPQPVPGGVPRCWSCLRGWLQSCNSLLKGACFKPILQRCSFATITLVVNSSCGTWCGCSCIWFTSHCVAIVSPKHCLKGHVWR